jgi:hypothetical protein
MQIEGSVADRLGHRARRARAAVTNDPLRMRGLDARSRVGRRRQDLIAQYTMALGGSDKITEGQLADIVRAAELVALAEEARFIALTKGGADLSALSRLEGCADRAVRRLRIGQKREPAQLTLVEHLAKRAAGHSCDPS